MPRKHVRRLQKWAVASLGPITGMEAAATRPLTAGLAPRRRRTEPAAAARERRRRDDAAEYVEEILAPKGTLGRRKARRVAGEIQLRSQGRVLDRAVRAMAEAGGPRRSRVPRSAADEIKALAADPERAEVYADVARAFRRGALAGSAPARRAHALAEMTFGPGDVPTDRSSMRAELRARAVASAAASVSRRELQRARLAMWRRTDRRLRVDIVAAASARDIARPRCGHAWAMEDPDSGGEDGHEDGSALVAELEGLLRAFACSERVPPSAYVGGALGAALSGPLRTVRGSPADDDIELPAAAVTASGLAVIGGKSKAVPATAAAGPSASAPPAAAVAPEEHSDEEEDEEQEQEQEEEQEGKEEEGRAGRGEAGGAEVGGEEDRPRGAPATEGEEGATTAGAAPASLAGEGGSAVGDADAAAPGAGGTWLRVPLSSPFHRRIAHGIAQFLGLASRSAAGAEAEAGRGEAAASASCAGPRRGARGARAARRRERQAREARRTGEGCAVYVARTARGEAAAAGAFGAAAAALAAGTPSCAAPGAESHVLAVLHAGGHAAAAWEDGEEKSDDEAGARAGSPARSVRRVPSASSPGAEEGAVGPEEEEDPLPLREEPDDEI